MRNVGGAGNAGNIIQVVKVRDTFGADVLISAPLTSNAEISAGNAFASLHIGRILTLGAPLSRTAMAARELG